MPPGGLQQPTRYPWPGTIIPWSAALRSGTNRNARTLADLPHGETVKVTNAAQGWLFVELNLDGKRPIKGYVSRELIQPAAPTNTAPTASRAPAAQNTKEQWQLIARQNAFGVQLAQQITRGAAWIPERGFEASRQIIAKVYDYYGALYRRNPIKFQWAGLARMAGGPFYKGFCDMEQMRAGAQAGIDARRRNPFLSSASSQQNPGGELAEMAMATNLQQALLHLMHMGRDIFNDLAWQHEAYQAMGLAEIRRLVTLRVLDSRYSAAWEKIDSRDPQRVWEGNARLLQFEQEDILRVRYGHLGRMPLVPLVMSALAQSPHPWGQAFHEFHGYDLPWTDRYLPQLTRDVTKYSDRWPWLQRNIWPTWKRRTDAERTRLINRSLADLGARRF